jgi:hypothetical protein
MKKHYLLFTVTVAYLSNGITRQQGLNILAVEESENVTRSLLGIAQQQAQVRFMSEVDPKAEIKDVLINNITHLGHMTPEEFHAGFEVPDAKSPETGTEAPAAEQTASPAGTNPGLDQSDLPASARSDND